LAEADASGTITAVFDYAPYGAQALGAPPSGPGYTGHVDDAESGFVYMQQRYYDPSVGRMLSRDSVTAYDTGDMRYFNAYAYAFNNPNRFSDPDGQCPTCDRFSDSYAQAAKEGRTGEFSFLEKPSISVATAALPLAPVVKSAIGLGKVVRALLNRPEAPRLESKSRLEPGADGAKSTITREVDRQTGDTLSKRHTVERGGEIIHQHQACG
jgi:RHS repeat-associated protein